MEQRHKECESQSTDREDGREDERVGIKSNHVSMLQRSERQFYDNLLVNIHHTLYITLKNDEQTLFSHIVISTERYANI